MKSKKYQSIHESEDASIKLIESGVVLLLHFNHFTAGESRTVFEVDAEHRAPDHEMTEQSFGISSLADHADTAGFRHVQTRYEFETLSLVSGRTGFHVIDECGVPLILSFRGDLTVADIELHGFKTEDNSCLGLDHLFRLRKFAGQHEESSATDRREAACRR